MCRWLSSDGGAVVETKAQLGVDPADDGAEGLVAGEFLDECLVGGVLGEACAEVEGLGELADDLEALDGVDGEVGLEVEVGFEHVDRVAGAVGDDLLHRRHQLVG